MSLDVSNILLYLFSCLFLVGCMPNENDNIFHYELSDGYECKLDDEIQTVSDDKYNDIVYEGTKLGWFIPEDSTKIKTLVDTLGCKNIAAVRCDSFLPDSVDYNDSTCISLKAYGDSSGANPVSVSQSEDKSTIIATVTLRIDHPGQRIQLVPSPVVVQASNLPSKYRFIVTGERTPVITFR